MDPILLKQKTTKWIEACQFLKSAEIKEQLDAAEWTAVEELSNLWNKNFSKDSVKDDALDYIATLKQCENLHPNNLKIKEYSKQLSGVARDMFTKDVATYNEFKAALQALLKEIHPKTPRKPPVVGQVPKTPQAPKVPQTPKIINTGAVEFTTIEFESSDANNNIIANYGSPIHLGDNYINPRVTIRTQRNDTIKVSVEVKYEPTGELIDTFEREIKLNGSGRYELTGRGQDSGGYFPRDGVYQYIFKIHGGETYIGRLSVLPSPKANAPGTITGIKFANVTFEGNIITDYGGTLYDDSQYLKPMITISTQRIGSVRYEIQLTSPSGAISRTEDDVMIHGSGDYKLVGYGNKQGNFYETGLWGVKIIMRGFCETSTVVRINPRRQQPRQTYQQKPITPITPNYQSTQSTQNGNSGSRTIVKILKWVGIIAIVFGAFKFGLPLIKSCTESSKNYEYAIADGVSLFSKPDGGSKPKVKLKERERVNVKEQNGEWFSVELDDGTSGFVHYSYIVTEAEYNAASTVFKNSDAALQTEFKELKYQVMKRQAFLEFVNAIVSKGHPAANLKLIDLKQTQYGAEYGAVGYLISNGKDIFFRLCSFDESGVPHVEWDKFYYGHKEDVVEIRRITANGSKTVPRYTVQLRSSTGERIFLK